MTKDKNYKKVLENLNPIEAVKGKEKHFSEKKYLTKLLKYAKKMGVKVSYYSLLLFYSFKSPTTPKSAKLTIAGALGYLIFPVDLIPDFVPVVGFTDDITVIVYALYSVISHIDAPVKQQAHERMIMIFGDNYDEHGEIEEKFKSK
ncbi:YkvA family protein [Virgibacillus byunsanensis]|uniref:YkvA family protein n=1 Tax=Virgibacillus byunsanensis TaxID=570945 RepID=A0ABW3LIV6_9BACI